MQTTPLRSKSRGSDRVSEECRRCEGAYSGLQCELAKRASPEIEAVSPLRTAKKGFVYAISSGEHVKIGLAANVKRRILGLQTSCPTALSVINAWEHHDAERMERLLHRKYRKFRTSGEWFRLSEELIEGLRAASRPEDLL